MPSRIRICRISPVAKGEENWGRSHKELLEEVVHDGLEVIDTSLPEVTIPSVTSSYDVTMIAEAHAKRALQAENEGFDAVVLNCLLEPGLSACRELVSIPVVGDTGSALHLASLVSRRFSFLLPGSKKGIGSRMVRDIVRMYGFEGHIASFRVVGIPTLGFSKTPERYVIERMLEEAQAAIEQDAAEAIIGYGGPDIYIELRRKLPVPVISPVQSSVIIAEALVRAKLSQSKICFPFPDNLEEIRKNILYP
jgi:allantoin racemase